MRLIEGVRVKRLRVIPDERGRVMEILRRDDDLFLGFGQAYLTTVTKAWHCHERQTDNFVVVGGMAKLVLYDEREDSPTRGLANEFFLGIHNPLLVQIPPRVWHGLKCVGETECLVINFPTEPYDYGHPDEHRLEPHGSRIPYDWGRRDG